MLKRFLWSYIGLCVLPFLLLGVLVANFSSESIQEELLNAVEISMDESYRSITGIMSSAREISLTLMNEPDLQRQLHALEEESADKAQILEELGSWLETYPIYGSNRMKLCLYLQNLPQDSLELDTELVKVVPKDFSETWYVQAMEKPNRFYWYLNNEGVSSFLCHAKCFYSTEDWETVLGVLTIQVDLNVMRSIAMAANTTGNRLYLTDETGNIVYPYYNYDHIPEEILSSGVSGLYELEDKLILVKPIENTGWSLIKNVPLSEIDSHTDTIVHTILVLAVLFAICSLMATIYYYRQISSPIQKLASRMKRVQAGDLMSIESDLPKGEIGELYRSFNFMTQHLHSQIEETYVAQIRQKDAELRALQAQINPHFLYNTLDSINWLALRYKANDISNMVLALSDMLRLSLNRGRDILTIADELRQVDSYITLQKVRYNDSFSVEYRVDEKVKKRRIVKMLLQPIVENAIVHGFEQIETGGLIVISVQDQGEFTYFEVSNNGELIDLEKMAQRISGSDEEEETRRGYGIRNVNQRIKAFYGQQYGISYSIRDGCTVASFTLPREGGYGI